jgi:cytochrome c oxidase subunit III
MKETMEADEKKLKDKSATMMLYVGMISIVMFFAAFVSAFIVSKGGVFWVNVKLPSAFLISTAVIVLSSLTISLALSSVRKNKISLSNSLLLITFLLGITFTLFQFRGWNQLIENGSYFTEQIMDDETGEFVVKGEYGTDFTITFKNQELVYENGRLYYPDGKELSDAEYEGLKRQRNTASSYIYIITVMHVLHLIGGLIYLLLVIISALRKSFDMNNHLKIKLISIYWHFLGGLWIFLFMFLQFIH